MGGKYLFLFPNEFENNDLLEIKIVFFHVILKAGSDPSGILIPPKTTKYSLEYDCQSDCVNVRFFKIHLVFLFKIT